MSVRLLGALALLAGVTACGDRSARSSVARDRVVTEAAIDAVRETALARLGETGCDPSASVCLRGLVVTAHMCLTCRDVGLLVRTLAAHPGAPLVLFAPASEQRAVERFLRDERSVAVVLPTPSPALTEDRAPELLGYFELGPDSVEVRRAVGYRAAAVLEVLGAGA